MRPPKGTATILMADDDPDDCLFIEDALKEAQMAADCRFVEDGQELMDYLLHQGSYSDASRAPCPDLVLLDLNMPRKDGREALREIKSHPGLKKIPIVVLTTSSDSKDICTSYELGASSFIVKPSQFGDFIELSKELGRYWFNWVKLPPKNEC